MQYELKPRDVEARVVTVEEACKVAEWCNGSVLSSPDGVEFRGILLTTAEGMLLAPSGFYVAKGADGTFVVFSEKQFNTLYQRKAEKVAQAEAA